MLMNAGPRALLGPHSGIFLKPLRSQHKRALKQAVQGALVLQDFEPMQIDLLRLYNKALTSNRTWWFRFNQLPTLAWAAGVWDESNHGYAFIDFNFDVIKNWVGHSNDQLPLKWHDHASALRMKNMADWYITVASHSTEYGEALERLAGLIDEHLQWLCEDKNYSRRTNHGFEQARFMMSVASEMPGLPASTKAIELALHRLQDEILFAFTGQGVHKENSPGYQWFMIKVMQQAKAMLDGYGLELPDIEFRKTIDRAKRFLDVIALPDNSLPLIGDTIHKKKQNAYIAKLRKNKPKGEGVQVFDYSKSGYVIVKDFTDQESPVHLAFKNGHLSDYHRHNDDLSIHLTKGNCVVFGDGGLYSHNKNDVGRQYAKSAWAHSTFFPTELAEKKIKRNRLMQPPELRFSERESIAGKTWLYGPDYVLERRLNWCEIAGLKELEISDSIVGGDSASQDNVVTNFLIPLPMERVHHNVEQQYILIDFGDFSIKLIYEGSASQVSIIYCRFDDFDNNLDSLYALSFVSGKMEVANVATRVEFRGLVEGQERKLKIHFV